MSMMAKYAQIIWCEPTNEDVRARIAAVETIRTWLSGKATRDAIELAGTIAGGFAGGQLPPSLAPRIEEAISAESPAFMLKGKDLQGWVCLAAAALNTIRGPAGKGAVWTTADALAASLWSALALQDQVEHAKLEELRQDLIDASRERVRSAARAARERRDVPDVGTLSIPENDVGGSRANAAYRRATAPVIEALKTNQELDREEVDFLWWAIADYSDTLKCALCDRDPFVRAVAGGLEAASMLRRLPHDGFRHAVLRHVGSSEALRLDALIGTLGESRAELGKPYAASWASELPLVFPLISSLVVDEHIPGTNVSLDARGWGARALLEASILTMEERAAGVR